MPGTSPMVMFAEIGFAVALGVLLDTIVVRSVLVTALTLDIGRWMWWPGGLARQRDVPPAGPQAGPWGAGHRGRERYGLARQPGTDRMASYR